MYSPELFIFTFHAFFFRNQEEVQRTRHEFASCARIIQSLFYDEETMQNCQEASFWVLLIFSICHLLQACFGLEVNGIAGDKKSSSLGKQLISLPKKLPEIYVKRLSGTKFLALIKLAKSLIVFLNSSEKQSKICQEWKKSLVEDDEKWCERGIFYFFLIEEKDLINLVNLHFKLSTFGYFLKNCNLWNWASLVSLNSP